MTTDITTKTNAGIATTGISPWEQVSRLAKQEGAKYYLYKKGDWMSGDEDVSGQRRGADPTEIYYGFQHWKNSAPGRVQMVRIDQLHLHPRREDLGDTDPSKWEVGPDGEQKDPWARTVRMGLFDLETRETGYFTSSSYGGRDAVNAFCAAYEKDRLRFPGQVPIVQLESASYRHKTYGKVHKPSFEIVGWTTLDGSEALPPVDPKTQVAELLNNDLPDFTL